MELLIAGLVLHANSKKLISVLMESPQGDELKCPLTDCDFVCDPRSESEIEIDTRKRLSKKPKIADM